MAIVTPVIRDASSYFSANTEMFPLLGELSESVEEAGASWSGPAG